MKYLFPRKAFLTGCLCLMMACTGNAPHDNPVDPEVGSAGYQIDGVVYSYYPPRQNLQGAALHLLPDNVYTTIDNNGYYQIKGIAPGAHTLICELTGYLSDTINIDLQNSITHDFFLNALPVFDEISITTHHISRWFPTNDLYYLLIDATLSDADGPEDVDSVWINISKLNYTQSLQKTGGNGIYSLLVLQEDMSLASLHQLEGQEFVFLAKDQLGAAVQSGAHQLSRIIEYTPEVISPIGLETRSDSTLQLKWTQIALPFSFTQRIEITHIVSGISVKTDEIDGIPPGNSSFDYNKKLDPGDYLWTLFVVDSFGNTSRSREGSFRIL